MEKIYSHLFEIVVAVLLLFVSVLIYFDLRTETVVKTLGSEAAQDFVADAEKHGYISTGDYESLMERLSLTDALYDMAFEHKHTLYEPEYRMRTLQEILDAQKAAYTGTNTYTYREVTTTAPAVYDPISNGSLNTETNESVFAKAVNTPADPNHVHTEACYIGSGHKHTTSVGATPFVHHHKHDSSCHPYVSYAADICICDNCGTSYSDYAYSAYWDDTLGKAVYNWSGYFNCPNCGSSSKRDCQLHTSWRYSCYYDIDLDNDGYCDKVGTDTYYDYYRSEPMKDGVYVDTGEGNAGKVFCPYKKTYVNGCFSYHVHGVFPGRFSYPYNSEIYWYYGSYGLENSGWNNYCIIPKKYFIGFNHEEATTGNSEDIGVYYEARIENDKLMMYPFGCSGIAGYWCNDFPVIDINTYANLRNSNSALRDFLILHDSGTSVWDDYNRANIIDAYEHGSSIETLKGDINICPLQEKTWYFSCTTPEIPNCNQLVSSIAATHPMQTVATGDTIITTAIITYLDGSTKTLVSTASGYNSNQLGNQTVTLTYAGKTCTITVKVIPRTKACSNGHVYNLDSNGSDPGCPYCRVWIRSLSFIYPTSTDMTITIGTTLQENGVKLRATYMDGHTEEVSDYIHNLDKTYFGTMQVIVGYKGVATQLRVTTVCAKMKCDICGHDYELYPDGSDPGCPYCISKIPVFTGNVNEYEETEYTEKILETLYKEGVYKFEKGDTFTVSIINKSSTVGRKLLRKFIPSLPDQWFDIRLKGKISTN